jgi:Tfp pilus assembly protein PilV
MREEDLAAGTVLIEVIISAVLVLVVGLGVLAMTDRTSELSAQQRSQAVAGNLAQEELDRVKGLPLTQLSNLRYETTRTVGPSKFTITSRADWINDTTMTANCTTTSATADYLKVTTTVANPSFPSRKPTVLDTIISPPVRAFDGTQGSLAVSVVDRNSAPVSGLTANLTGPKTLSDTTNDNGCVLWGYLPATSGYNVAFSRSGWVMPNGSAAGGGSVTVAGDATTNAGYQFDLGGSMRTNFKVRSAATGNPLIDTSPKLVRVDNSTGAGFAKTYDIGSTSSLDTASGGLLFPFTNPYAIYADGCTNAKPPAPTSGALTPGGSLQAADTVLPALHIAVTSTASGTALANATVRVITACGTVYTRTTNSAGKLDDPGFPYGTGFTVCATNGARKRVVTGQSNTNFANTGTVMAAMNITTSGSSSTNPTLCP